MASVRAYIAASVCCGFTLILLVFGVMDLRVMAAVGVALSVERLAARPERVARALGVAVLAVAFWQGLPAVAKGF